MYCTKQRLLKARTMSSKFDSASSMVIKPNDAIDGNGDDNDVDNAGYSYNDRSHAVDFDSSVIVLNDGMDDNDDKESALTKARYARRLTRKRVWTRHETVHLVAGVMLFGTKWTRIKSYWPALFSDYSPCNLKDRYRNWLAWRGGLNHKLYCQYSSKAKRIYLYHCAH